MQLPLETALLQLAVLAATEPGTPRIKVLAAYDANASTLQCVGRGLVVAPSAANLSAARLGALAFLAGFGYIERRRYPPSVYLSVPEGERFQIVRGPLQRLWPNARISGQGELQVLEFDAAGLPDPGFNSGMLQPFTNPGVTFAAPDVSNSVQASLASALTALTAALKEDAVVEPIQVLAAFDPKATNLQAVGRAVLMNHPKISADRLAGYALQAGFGFVQYRTDTAGGPAVYAAAYPARGGPLPGLFGDDDIILQATDELHVRPAPPVAGRLDWCLTPCCPGAGVLSTAMPTPDAPGETRNVLRATATGGLHVTATFSLTDAAEPYEFLLVPRDPATEPRLTKEQYDDLLNFLDALHPLGVVATTRNLRRFVHGFHRPLRWDNLPTRETYPRYRRDHS